MNNSADASAPAPGRRWAALAGLIIALALADSSLASRIAPGDALSDRLIHEAFWWSYAAIVIAWLVLVERQTLSAIGFRRPTWRTLVFGVLGGVVAIVLMIAHWVLVVPLFHLNGGHAGDVREQIMATPYWYRVLMVTRAAVVEELLFRAYIIEKVRQLTGSWIAGVLVSVIAFTYAHLSGWGMVQLIPVAAVGLLFALIYVWRRDTPSNIIAHFITDGMGFLMG